MTRRASSSYVRRLIVEHYAQDHPFIAGRRVMYCGGGHKDRGCDALITIGMDYWEGEHFHPTSLGGDDEPPNTWPACARCHKAKTKQDAPAIAKALAEKEKREGIRRSSKPMPHGRRSSTKMTMDGRVVPRD